MSQNTIGGSFVVPGSLGDYMRPQDNFPPGYTWPPPTDYLRTIYWPEFSRLVARVERLERGEVVEEEVSEFVRNLICVS